MLRNDPAIGDDPEAQVSGSKIVVGASDDRIGRRRQVRSLPSTDASVERLAPQTEMRVPVEVPLDHSTLEVLQERVDREGRPFTEAVGDPIRATSRLREGGTASPASRRSPPGGCT